MFKNKEQAASRISNNAETTGMKIYAEFIAGWLAGGASLLVGHPLDTIKTRLQTCSSYRGIADCIIQTLKHERIYGLYKGMLLPFLSAGLLHSLLFSGYGITLRLLHPGDITVDSRKDLPLHEIIIASVIGSIVQLIPSVPIEHVKTKLQVQRNEFSRNASKKRTLNDTLYRNPLHCALEIYKVGGTKALYEGGLVMLYRDCLGLSIYLSIWEYLNGLLSRMQFPDVPTQILAGGLAGSGSWLCVCPFEYIKSQLQTSRTHQIGILQIVRQTYQTCGICAFYKGGLTLVLRGFPVNAVLFVVYAKSIKFLENL